MKRKQGSQHSDVSAGPNVDSDAGYYDVIGGACGFCCFASIFEFEFKIYYVIRIRNICFIIFKY